MGELHPRDESVILAEAGSMSRGDNDEANLIDVRAICHTRYALAGECPDESDDAWNR
jgi:hypothetical protein